MCNARERIEQEFDQPLRNVIEGMREQGCTWRTVALALEVSRQRVYQFRKKCGLSVTGDRLYDDLSFPPCKADRNAQALGYRSARQAVVDLRMSGKTIAEVAQVLGISVRTVQRHYPPGFSGTVFVRTERYIRTRHKGQGPWGCE